jgi:hypothetical protein
MRATRQSSEDELFSKISVPTVNNTYLGDYPKVKELQIMSENKQSSEETNYTGLGMSLGMLFGAAMGVVIWLTTDLFVFFPVFIGAGLSVGLAVGAARDKEKDGE